MAGHSTDGVTPIECSHGRDSESNVLSERSESKDYLNVQLARCRFLIFRLPAALSPLLRPTARRSSLLVKVSFSMQSLLKKFVTNNKLGGGVLADGAG
jgi:hypothetical protein